MTDEPSSIAYRSARSEAIDFCFGFSAETISPSTTVSGPGCGHGRRSPVKESFAKLGPSSIEYTSIVLESPFAMNTLSPICAAPFIDTGTDDSTLVQGRSRFVQS